MPLPPLLAAEAAGKAQKALTGDIYTRRWVQKPKKGKHKGIPIEHEVRVNALTGIVVVVGTAVAGMVGATALWLGHRKLSYGVPSGGAKLHYIVKQYDAVSHLETVVDEAAWVEEIRDYYLVDNVLIPPPDTTGGGGTAHYQ